MDLLMMKKRLEAMPDQMTPAERSEAYNCGKEVDYLPFSFPGNGETLAPLYGFTVGQYRYDFDIHCHIMDELRQEFGVPVTASAKLGLKGVGEALGSTVLYPENSIDYVDRYILTDYSLLSSLEFNPHSNVFLQAKIHHIHKLKKRYGDNTPVSINLGGPLSSAASVRKTEFLLRDMRKNQENLHRLLEFMVYCLLTWVGYVKEEFGTVSVGIADPVSSYTLISDRMFREFSKPYLKKLIKGVFELTGSIPGIHICGRSKPIWKDLAELGFHSFSVDNCEDLEELKNRIGNQMQICGNVPPVDVMLKGTPEDVTASVHDCIRKASDNPKGYILDVGCQLPLGTPRENIYAYICAAKYYGRKAKKGRLCEGLFTSDKEIPP